MSAPSRFSARDHVARALSEAGLVPGTPLVVGFSGGPDSVALVTWLLACGHPRLVLAHLDHGLREESARDAQWVRQFAKDRGLAVQTERVDVQQRAHALGVGIEEAGRAARYALYAHVAREQNMTHVALGHQADDQVETLLFRLLRGSGSRGLGAMAPHGTREAEGFSYSVLRPLLKVWRREILDFLKAENIPFLQDSSNTDPQYARNRIRHLLLPEMEKALGRPVRESLWRTAEVLRAEDEFLSSLEGGAVGEEWLEVRLLRTLHLALQRRVVARWLRARGVPDVGYAVVERVLDLIRQVRTARVNLPGASHAIRRRGRIYCIPEADPRQAG